MEKLRNQSSEVEQLRHRVDSIQETTASRLVHMLNSSLGEEGLHQQNRLWILADVVALERCKGQIVLQTFMHSLLAAALTVPKVVAQLLACRKPTQSRLQ